MAKTTLEQWDETNANNTDVGSINIDENCPSSGMNNAVREHMSQIAKWLGDDTLASAATTDLGSVPGRYKIITGTVTITGLGTIKAGTIAYLKFSGILTLTHNATSLILPGGGNIITAAGDTAIVVSEGSGNWRCVSYQRAQAVPLGEYGFPLLHVVDEKTSTTAGGASTAGLQLRTLNTIVGTNEISGASVATSIVTLPIGTYWIEGSAPAFRSDAHKCYLENASGGAVLIPGSSEYASNASLVQSRSFLSGRLVAATSLNVRLFHNIANATLVNGLGVANSSGVERYSELKIWRLK